MKVLLTLLFALLASVCFGTDLQFSWEYPEEPSDVSFRLYKTTSPGQYILKSEDPDNNDLIWEGIEKQCQLPIDTEIQHWFIVTATDGTRESTPATEIVFGKPVLFPPGNFQVTAELPLLDRTNWEIVYTTSFEPDVGDPTNAIDGDEVTQWSTKWGAARHPHAIQIDLGAEYTIDGFSYLSRRDTVYAGDENGMIKEYKFYTTLDRTVWTEPVAEGEFPKSRELQIIRFPQITARIIKLKSFSEVNGGPWTTIAELNVFGIQNVSIEEIK